MSGLKPRKPGSSRVGAHYSQDSKTHTSTDGAYNTIGARKKKAGGSGGFTPSVSFTTLYQYTGGYTMSDRTFVRNVDPNKAGAQVIEEEAKKLIEDKSIIAFSFSNNPETGVLELYQHASTTTLTKDSTNSSLMFSYLNMKYIPSAATMPSAGDKTYPGVEFTIPTYTKDISLDNTAVMENAVGATVGSVTSTLSKADTAANVSYELNNGIAHDKFFIDGSTLKLIDGEFLDYETASSHNLSITSIVDNNPFAYTTKTFTIEVTNVVSEGPKSITLSGTTIDENLPTAYTIGTVSSEHHDSTAAGLGISYSIDDPSGNFLIDGNLLKKKDNVTFNYEHETGGIFDQRSFDITIIATDAFGHALSKSFTITVNNKNEEPFDISLSSNTIMEMSAVDTVIGTFSTSDEDNIAGQAPTQTHTYSIEQSSFEPLRIEGNQLVIKKSNLGASTYSISITSTDSGTPSRSYTKTFDIILQAYAGPSNISLSSYQIAENSDAGTIVGALSATAGDSNDITFYMNNTSFFDVALADDGITYNLISTKKFDHETKDRYSALVICRDGNMKYYSQVILIEVTNVVEGPTDITLYELTTDQPLTGNLTVNENMNSGYNLGYLNATGRDSNDLTFSIENNNTNFILSSSTPIFLKTNASFNYEAETSYTVTIKVTDGNGQFATKDFTVDVVDVNEAPHTMQLSSNTHTVGSDIGTTIGSLTVTDPDAGDKISWSVNDDNNNDYFEIERNESNTKEATLKNQKVIDTAQTISITVTATDLGGLNVSTTFSILVEPEPSYLKFTYNTGDTNDALGDVYALAVKGSSNLEYTVEWSNGQISGKNDNLTPFGGHAHMMYFSSSTAWAKIIVTAGSVERLGTQDYRAWDSQYVSTAAENFLTEVTTNSNDWGLPGLISLFNGFTNCKYLQTVPDTLPTTVTDLKYCFQNAKFTTDYVSTSEGVLNTSRPFLNWDMSNVEDYSFMFATAGSDDDAWLTAEDFSGWNTGEVQTMTYMFMNQKKLLGNGLDQWDTSQCTDFSSMFSNCRDMNVPLRGWTVDSSSNLTNMFSNTLEMTARHGNQASSPEYTEYYAYTPDIEFFNYTPTTIEMLDGTVHVLSVPASELEPAIVEFDPEYTSPELQGHDKESILKLTLGSEVTSISTKFKDTNTNTFSRGFYTIDMSNSKITTLPDECFKELYVQHAILNKELIEISNNCFSGCVAFCVLTIPEDSDLNYIGTNAFENAPDFKGLYLPPKVCDESQNNISFNSSAFSDSSLEYVYFGSKGDNTANSDGVQTLKGKDNVDVTVDVTDYNTTKITTSNGTVTSCNIVGEAGSHLNFTIWIDGIATNVLVGTFKTSVVEIDLGSITSIKSNTFTYMPKLKVIDFRRANMLETILNNSFKNPGGSTTLETVHFHEDTYTLLTSLGSDIFQGNDNIIFDTLDLSVYPTLTQILGKVFTKSEITTLKLGEGITSFDDWNPFCEDTIETLDLSKATSLTFLSTADKSDNPFGNQSNISKVILHAGVTSVNNYFGNSDNIQIEIPESNALNITESTTALGNHTVTVTFV
jgi:hypothetical protein